MQLLLLGWEVPSGTEDMEEDGFRASLDNLLQCLISYPSDPSIHPICYRTDTLSLLFCLPRWQAGDSGPLCFQTAKFLPHFASLPHYSGSL